MSASNALKIETFFCLVNVHSISRYRSYGMGTESREIKAKTRTTINNQEIGKEASIRQHAKIGRQRLITIAACSCMLKTTGLRPGFVNKR